MTVRSVFLELSEDEQEWYEERAAILEYEAGLPRHIAEASALGLISERRYGSDPATPEERQRIASSADLLGDGAHLKEGMFLTWPEKHA